MKTIQALIEIRSAAEALGRITAEQWMELAAQAKDGATLLELASHLDVGIRDVVIAAQVNPAIAQALDVLLTHSRAHAARQAREAIVDENGRFSERAYRETMRNLGQDPAALVVHRSVAHNTNTSETEPQIDMTAFLERFKQFVPEPPGGPKSPREDTP